ncbi:MAG: hypothetical protein ACRCZ9_06995, partial [Fusobacteriaceae bacterium]
IENENSITILSSGGNSGGIQGNMSSVFNTGKILIDGTAITAIGISGSKVENDGEIIITGNTATGISSNQGLINNGDITLNTTGVNSVGISSYTGLTINTGEILVSGFSAVGIKTNGYYGENSPKTEIENEGNITVIGDAKIEKQPSSDYYTAYNGARGIDSNEGDVYNSGDIVAKGDGAYLEYVTDWGTSSVTASAAKGIVALNAEKVTNEGNISVEGDSTNLNSRNGAIGLEVSGKSYYDSETGQTIYVSAETINSGNITVTGEGGTGINLSNSDLVNTGEILVSGLSSIGIKNNDSYGNSSIKTKIENEGSVTVIGDAKIEKQSGSNYYNSYNAAVGINSNSGDVYNSGDVVAKGDGAYLKYETDWGTSSQTASAAKGILALNAEKVENYGNINVEGNIANSSYENGAIGLEASGKSYYDPSPNQTINIKVEVLNSGNINVIGDCSTGVKITNGDLTNNSKITVEGQYTKAVCIIGENSTATNNGIINIDGNGSYGMYASSNSTVVNGLEGTINVGASAAGGMYANYGSTAINDGTINIHKDNVGGESIAMVGPGTLINTGIITTDTDLTVNTTNGGSYVIGSSESGTYGKISGKNVSIDGEVVVSSNITKNGFKDEYTMQNVVDAEELKLGEEFKFVSNSLLYDAESVTDRWGNLDATLNRNDKVLSNFTTGYSTYTANIFGKYQNEDTFKALSSEAKEVIKSIDTSSSQSIEESLNNLTPTIYSNLGRQMLDTSETFKAQDAIAINSLGENSYNFTFLGEYRDVDSRGNIEGYESELSGFVGAMSFGDGTFGTLGYGHNSVDYDENGSGKIETIHLGLNRYSTYSGYDFKLGLGGEYNFHENKRDIDSL